MNPVAVIGEGAWGTAIAQVLADNGHEVALWCHDAAVAREIEQNHINTCYMPGFVLSELIHAFDCLEPVLQKSEFVFVSTPTVYFRNVVTQCRGYYRPEQCWTVLSKGIEGDTLLVPSQIATQVLDPKLRFAVLGGPSFAHDVMKRNLTAVTIAARTRDIAEYVASLLTTSYFCPFIADDVLGIQLGGALKNVGALLLGVAAGAGWSDNTCALLFTRCWQEMVVLAIRCGAQRATLDDLSGIGDLFLTVSGRYSRNRLVGTQLGAGRVLGNILGSMCQIPEGINTVKTVQQLVERYCLNVPVFDALYRVIFLSAPCDLLLQAAVQAVVQPEK